MAEIVNQRIEGMINELEQMKRIDLYTEEEIKIITKKRKDFEYKIHRRIRCKDDFFEYIAYECILLQDIKLRRENYFIKDKKNDIEYNIAKRVIKLYKEMISRFGNDMEVWLNFMTFCKSINFIGTVTSYLENFVQMHGNKPKIWQLAGRWEYEESNNIDNARKFLLKGLQRHADSEDLFVDLFRIELLIAEASLESESELDTQMKRVDVVLNNALKNIDETSFIIKLCEILDDFKFAVDLRKKLINKLWENHADKIETWSFIAICELQEKDVFEFNWRSFNTECFSSRYSTNLQNFINVHETAISHINTRKSVLSYINNTVKLITDDNLNTEDKLQVINDAFTKGHNMKFLNEEYYKIWLDILCSGSGTGLTEIVNVLEEACVYLPTSVLLWSERLKRCGNNANDLLDLFKKAKLAIPTENMGPIWKIVIEYVTDVSILEKLYEQSLTLLPKTAFVVKPLFLKAFHEHGGIDVVREKYKTISINPPFNVELHNVMIDIEKREEKPNLHRIRQCYELSIQQLGKSDSNIWLKYIEFEIQSGHPGKCGSIYKRACSFLDNTAINQFMTEYSKLIVN